MSYSHTESCFLELDVELGMELDIELKIDLEIKLEIDSASMIGNRMGNTCFFGLFGGPQMVKCHEVE